MSFEKAKELCTLLNAEKVLINALTNLSDTIFSDPDDVEAKTQFRAAINLSIPPFIDGMCEVYMEIYTSDELDAMIAYRKSALGMKEMEVRPLIEERSRGLMDKLMTESLRKIGVEI